VDASNVIGDANALQGQTCTRIHHSPQLTAAASLASATQIYAAPSLYTRKDYQIGLSVYMYQLTPNWNSCQMFNQVGPLCIINICSSCLQGISNTPTQPTHVKL